MRGAAVPGQILQITAQELHALTRRHTRPAQIRRLMAMGIKFIDDPGEPCVLVLRSVVERAGGNEATSDEQAPKFEWMLERA